MMISRNPLISEDLEYFLTSPKKQFSAPLLKRKPSEKIRLFKQNNREISKYIVKFLDLAFQRKYNDLALIGQNISGLDDEIKIGLDSVFSPL
jgi:hypothetical protein